MSNMHKFIFITFLMYNYWNITLNGYKIIGYIHNI